MQKGFWENRLPLLEVLLLLVAIIICIGWYGLAEKPIVLSDEIRQADIKSLFERIGVNPLDSGMALTQNDSALLAESQADETIDTSSKYILFCGDSMTEESLHALRKIAEANGHQLFTCIWYSSDTKLWSETNRLAILIKEYKPDFVFFTLGSNELFIKNINDREKYIKDIVLDADTANIPFVWIGPPNWKDDTGINNLIETAVGESRFYESKNLRKKLARKSDGAHPTRAGAAVWVDSIVTWFGAESKYKNKLLLHNPKDSGFINNRTYVVDNEPCTVMRGRYKRGIRILQPNDKPVYCNESSLAAANPDSSNTTIASLPPQNNTTIANTTPSKPVANNSNNNNVTVTKNNSSKQDTTPKNKIPNPVKDSSTSDKVPGDLPLTPKDSLK